MAIGGYAAMLDFTDFSVTAQFRREIVNRAFAKDSSVG